MKNVLSKISLNKIILWMTVIQFFITGAFYWFSYNHLSSQEKPDYPINVSKETQKQVEKIQRNYEASREQYERTIDSLNNRLYLTDHVLKREIEYAYDRKAELEGLLTLYWDSLTTEEYLNQCDSLRAKTKEYLVVDAHKDSLLELKSSQLAALNAQTVELFETCDSTNRKLKEQIDFALWHTKLCEEQLKKQKRQNRIWKIGAGVLAAFTIGLALK